MLTDESRLAVALTSSTFETFAKESESGGGGEVSSVNGQTGIVVLDAADVGALSEDAATLITDTKPAPIPADTIIVFDSEVVGNPPRLASIGSLLVDTLPDLAPLGLWDCWYWWKAAANGAASSDAFTGAAVSSGTNSTALPTGGMAGYNDHGIFLRSSTTADSGYRYQTSSLVGMYFGGGVSRKFRGQFLWRTSFTGRTVRMGFLDNNTVSDSVDGAYFEMVGSTCSAKTANNSTRTTDATTIALALDTAYTFDIDVNAAGTSARFRVYSGTSATALMDVTITTNIPTTSARTFGAGIVATEVSTTASDIGILYGMGLGTVEAFQTRDVAPLLGDIQAILESI